MIYISQFRPETRVVYVTSQPLDSSIVEYYWKLLPGHVPFSQIRHRLLLLSTYDSSPKPLSVKILERPRLIDRLTCFSFVIPFLTHK